MKIFIELFLFVDFFALILEQHFTSHFISNFSVPEISGVQMIGGAILLLSGVLLARK